MTVKSLHMQPFIGDDEKSSKEGAMNGPETNATTEPSTNTADASTGPASAPADKGCSSSTSGSGADRRETKPSGSQTTSKESLSDDDAFQFNCLRNARYHEDRERYYSRLHRWTMFIVVVTGTATITSLLTKSSDLATVSAIFSAVAGATDLVFDVSGKAKLHASLRQRFYSLLASAISNEATLVELRKAATLIYADEPPCMHAVNAIAYNGSMDAYGRPKNRKLNIYLHHRIFRNVFSFATTQFKTFQEVEEEKKNEAEYKKKKS